MRFLAKAFAGAVAGGLLASGAHANIITGVSTNTGNLDGNLTSFTTEVETFTDLAFSTASNVGGTIVFQSGIEQPVTQVGALSDPIIATGALNAGPDAQFNFGAGNVGASDVLFIFFNAAAGSFFQGPGEITAVDESGSTLGTYDASGSIATGDEITAFNAARVGASTLNGRLLAGLTVDVASFDVADASAIAGFVVPGEFVPNPSGGNPNGTAGTFDPHTVGLAVIPEPSSIALVAVGGLATLRRRK